MAFFLAKIVGLWYNYQEQGRAIPPTAENYPYFSNVFANTVIKVQSAKLDLKVYRR
ncbi:hypothetical protein [Ruminococcus bicirculans (ex Wegman et al. 2014)]|uniref:hypothetical protein n=1 Tax=Ruminococcus bicirculans (ex Wegman et al. 2014) TaxID=1160721 RepID=UPI000AC7B3A7